jgi:hypothetical protein
MQVKCQAEKTVSEPIFESRTPKIRSRNAKYFTLTFDRSQTFYAAVEFPTHTSYGGGIYPSNRSYFILVVFGHFLIKWSYHISWLCCLL